MTPSETMKAVIAGVRYRVSGSTLLASDAYWDGHNFERSGRNTFLYRSPKGRYFAVHLTQWQGEVDSIEPLGTGEAYKLYERLREQELEPEEAFPRIVIEEA